MDAFSVLHTDRTKCSRYAIKLGHAKWFFLIIKPAASIILHGYTSILLCTNNNAFLKLVYH